MDSPQVLLIKEEWMDEWREGRRVDGRKGSREGGRREGRRIKNGGWMERYRMGG